MKIGLVVIVLLFSILLFGCNERGPTLSHEYDVKATITPLDNDHYTFLVEIPWEAWSARNAPDILAAGVKSVLTERNATLQSAIPILGPLMIYGESAAAATVAMIITINR